MSNRTLVQPQGRAWQVSIPLDVSFCVEALEEALILLGGLDFFSIHPGAVSSPVSPSLACCGVRISRQHGGQGAWRDNVVLQPMWRTVKYEEVYLRGYSAVSVARGSIKLRSHCETTHIGRLMKTERRSAYL